jgi:hypothetical protein
MTDETADRDQQIDLMADLLVLHPQALQDVTEAVRRAAPRIAAAMRDKGRTA